MGADIEALSMPRRQRMPFFITELSSQPRCQRAHSSASERYRIPDLRAGFAYVLAALF